LIKEEVGSCSSNLLCCEGVDGLNGPSSPHCEQVKVVGESSLGVLDCIIFLYKRMGLAIKR